jgi:hypothetical protein
MGKVDPVSGSIVDAKFGDTFSYGFDVAWVACG